MFLGEYQHNIDYKGRLAVPKKFRQQLGGEPILTRGLDGCLFLYPKSSWEALTEKMTQLPLTQADARAFSRYLFGGATQVDFDKLGRVVIPDYLKTYAVLDKKIVIIGVLERVEIWDSIKWKKLEATLRKSGEIVAERLSGSGI